MLKYLHRLIAVFSLILFAGPAFAEDDTVKSLTLSVYNHGQALVNEVRTIKVPKGVSRLEFKNVPQTIEPETLQVKSLTSPESFLVLDMNYEYDLISVRNLLNKYIGKELRIVIPDAEDAEKTVLEKAVLLSNNDRPVFEIDDKVYIGNYSSLYLADMPKGLRANPALVWLVDNKGPKKHDVSVSYLANQITWKSDYVLKLDKDSATASLAGWVTLDNKTGKAFIDADLKLVAGDVNTVQEDIPIAFMSKAAAGRNAVFEDAQMRQEEFFEYHLYSLPRKVDVANNQSKQVSLLSASLINTEKILESYYGRYPSGSRNEIKQKAEVFIAFKNNKTNDLGVPLPKGIIRAYQESSDGSVLFVGEDSIDHTPKDETVKLKMGEAFDVQVKRVLKDYEKKGKDTIKYTWLIKIRNSKDTVQKLVLKDYVRGDWNIVSSTHKYNKINANHISFVLDVEPTVDDKEHVVEYSVLSEI